jgi:DNA polymerase-3 subunit epsilon
MSFDLETTGISPAQDRIVQMGVSYFRNRRCIQQHKQSFNPQIPIPAPASNVHGIYDHMVQSSPTLAEFLPRLHSHFMNQAITPPSPLIITGYNIVAYDLPLFHAEIQRCLSDFPNLNEIPCLDLIFFVRWFLRHEKKQKLTDICERFSITLDQAHDALADARVCGFLINSFLDSGYLPPSLDEALKFHDLIKEKQEAEYKRYQRWFYNDRQTGELCLGQGKHLGKPVSSIDSGYFKYLLNKVDNLPTAVKEICQQRV